MALPLQPGGSIDERTLQYSARSYYIASRTGGRVFFVDSVDGTDDDDNPGTHPYSPVLTVTRALALCVANNGDIIQILKNSPSGPHADETFPISVNKQGVTIRGTLGASGGMLSDSGIGSDEQDVATFSIAAHYVTIEDLYIGCDDLNTTGGLIEFSGAWFGTTLRRITFDTQRIPAYGVYVAASLDVPYLLVEDCVFGRYDIAGYTTAGIYIHHSTCGMFRRNVFNACAGIAISVSASGGNFCILDNRISMPSDGQLAIVLADGSSGIYIDGNHASWGTADPTDPYEDLNGDDDSNHWGINYKGITATLPKLT